MCRFVLLVLLVISLAGNSLAQTPQDVSAVFPLQVYALDGDATEGAGELLDAQLVVQSHSPASDDTSITLEINNQVKAPLLRLTKSALPADYQYLLGDDDSRLFQRSNRGGNLSYDLKSPRNAEPSKALSYQVKVYYASGEPAAGVELESRFGMTEQSATLLNRQIVPADGQVHLRQPQFPVEDSQSIHFVPRGYLMLKATDPSGQTQTLSFPQTEFKDRIIPDYDSVYLAMMPRETTATAFHGKVLSPDGSPVSDAKLGFQRLEFAGRGGEGFNNSTPAAVTVAADGTFSLGVPKNFLLARMGVEDLPASATLRVSVPGYSMGAELKTTGENVIKTPELTTVRFQIKASDGNLVHTDGSAAQVKFLQVSAPNASGARHAFEMPGRRVAFDRPTSTYSVEGVPVPGTYSVNVNGLRFSHEQLDSARVNDVVVFQQVNNLAEVSGSVFSAEVGSPVAGAFVISSFDGNADNVLIASSQADLEEAWAQWENLSAEKRNKDNHIKVGAATIFNVNGLTRTDAEGKFFMQFIGGEGPKFVHVYLPGRLGATCDIINNMKKKDGEAPVYDLPKIYLPDAAKVQVQVLGPKEVPGEFLDGTGSSGSALGSNYMVGCSFDLEDFRYEPPGMNSTKKNPWKLILYTGWQSEGNWPILPVPAGVKFSVTVSAPNTPTLGYANWSDLGPLAGGDLIKLPEKRVSAKHPFLVNVKKADGTPAVGISVRIDGALPLTTDAEGSVIGWSTGHVRRIEAMTDNTWNVAAEKRDVTVSSDSVTRVELTLPE